MKDFKDTLLMMKTDFPMRGNLGVNELPIQAKWEELKLYEKVLEIQLIQRYHSPTKYNKERGNTYGAWNIIGK